MPRLSESGSFLSCRQHAASVRGRIVKKRFIITGLILLVFFGGLAVFNYVLKPEIIRQVIAGLPVPSVPVTVADAKSSQWRAEIAAIGTLEAVRGVTISPQVAGRVEALMFRSGQTVKAGDSLVK